MSEEKRRFTRVSFDCQVFLEDSSGVPVEGRLIDVSIRGMRVQLEDMENLSTPVSFQILLGVNEPLFTIEGEAEVIRETDEGQVGLYLIKVDVDSLTHLQRLVELNLGDSEQAAEEIANW